MPSPLRIPVQETPPWTQWAAAEISAHRLLEQEVANLRGSCRSRCQQLKETRVWGTDWMDSVPKTHWWRDLSCVFVCATHNQPGRRNGSETLGLLRLAQVSSVFRRVLEKPSGCWKIPLSSCCSMQLAGCSASPPAGPGITEPRLTHQGRRKLQVSQSPTSSSCYWQSHFYCRYHWTLLVKNSAVLVTKQTDPTHFPKGLLPLIIFVFAHCQFVPLGQIPLQAILQDSGSEWKPRGVTFHCQLCTDVPLCTVLGFDSHLSGGSLRPSPLQVEKEMELQPSQPPTGFSFMSLKIAFQAIRPWYSYAISWLQFVAFWPRKRKCSFS